MTEPRRRRSWRWRHAVLLVPLAVLGACGGDEPQNALDPEGPFARQIDRLWDWSFWTAVVIFFLVEGLLVWILIRYRRRSDDDAPRQIHGSTPLEIGWTILPALILAVLAVPTIATIFDLDDRPEGPDVLNLTVTGHQWWWEIEYPGPDHQFTTANEIHIPVGTTVNVSLESFDVIHSFWIPRLAGKLDVVPGRTNHLALEADNVGVYAGQCAEYCGLSHANMRLRVYVDTPEDFQAWVEAQKRPATQPDGGLAAQGHQLFAEKGCVGCHTVVGYEGAEATVGPNLTHLMMRDTFASAIFELTPENLRQWLADPPAMKPMEPQNTGPKGNPLGMPDLGLNDDEIDALVAYLQTLN